MSKRDMDIRRNCKKTEDKIPQIPRLHIPRASLTSSSSSNASTSKSSSLCRKPNTNDKFLGGGESETEGIYLTSINHQQKLPTGSCKNLTGRQEMYLVHKAPKPSSLHSLSSTSSSLLNSGGSNQSNYSANSMLLSVKNLENFNSQHSEIYNKSDFDHRKQMLDNIKSILSVNEENLTTESIKVDNKKKKDGDQLSITSSATNTNFTVITFNGFNKERKKNRSICRRRHQVSIVIVAMTFLIFFGISSAVCMLEMRYQKMPR